MRGRASTSTNTWHANWKLKPTGNDGLLHLAFVQVAMAAL
jgi:hypothetical protein